MVKAGRTAAKLRSVRKFVWWDLSSAAKQRRPEPFQVTTNFEIPRDFSNYVLPECQVYFLEGLDVTAGLGMSHMDSSEWPGEHPCESYEK